jgi:hypothetical protein
MVLLRRRCLEALLHDKKNVVARRRCCCESKATLLQLLVKRYCD